MKSCSKFRLGKSCASARNPQPFSNFRKAPDRTDGHKSICKSCELVYFRGRAEIAKIKSKEWYWNNIERQKFYKVKKHYGIGQSEYKKISADQKNVCAICFKDRALVVDHCHETKIVRGLLCHQCNRALGLFQDNIHTIKRAIEYLHARDI